MVIDSEMRYYNAAGSTVAVDTAVTMTERFTVLQAGKKAVAHCRAGKGPYILEMLTYRYRGHSMSDPAQYRTRDEVKEVREHSDPIESLKNLIIENNFLTEDKLQVLNAEIKQVVDQSAQFAADSPLPDPSELFVDVYQ